MNLVKSCVLLLVESERKISKWNGNRYGISLFVDKQEIMAKD